LILEQTLLILVQYLPYVCADYCLDVKKRAKMKSVHQIDHIFSQNLDLTAPLKPFWIF